MKNKTFLANCALVLCAVIWGMNFIFQKQASQHLGAFTFISLRYYLGVLSLLPLFFYMRRRKALAALEAGEEVERWHGRRFWLASLGASLANWGGAVLVQIGLHVADATKAGFIESAYIALVPVLDLLLFRKKTSRRVWIGIAMAIVGLYLLCISDGFSLDVNDAAIMASTLCFALHILMWSRFSPHVDALPFMVVEFLCTGTLSGLVALFTESLTLADLTAAVVPLLFAGVLGVGVTYTIQIYAQRFTPASVAALLMSMEAVFSAVGGVIILHETLSVREWVGCGIMLLTMPLYRRAQAGLDRLLRRTRENLSGVRVIRAFHKEAEETAQFAEEKEILTRLQHIVGRISALMNPLTYVLINSAIVALIWTGAWQVERGALTQGQVVALVNYMSQILVELIKLANLIITITKAAACARRIESVFDENSSMTFPGEPAQDDPTAQDAVVFENVALRYSGAGAESLSGLSFRVRRGQTVGIIGGTGSGKSSLVNLIPRFYDATGGRILVDGVDVRDYPAGQLRSKIGIVPQKAVLFAGTIAENLRWGKEDATDAELQVALETSQAAEFVSTREGGLNAEVAQGGKNLSGGQRQRLTIARALVRDPKILILDDSASALDYATDARLRKAIRAHDANVTVFLVSQRAASIQYADQILVLDDGALVGQGTHAELLKSCPVYQEIYYSQFPKEAQNA